MRWRCGARDATRRAGGLALAALALIATSEACGDPAAREPVAPAPRASEPDDTGGNPPPSDPPAKRSTGEPPIAPAPPDEAYILDSSQRGPVPDLALVPDLRVSTRTDALGNMTRVEIEPISLALDPGPLARAAVVAHGDREQVRECSRVWHHQYARVANAALPLDAMAVHLSELGPFCDAEHLDSGLQTRLYVVASPAEEVVDAIRRGASDALGQLWPNILSGERDRAPDRSSPQRLFPDWTPVLVRFFVYYFHGGRPAQLDFHVRQFGEHTVVVVFMYARRSVLANDVRQDDMLSLIKSIDVWPTAP